MTRHHLLLPTWAALLAAGLALTACDRDDMAAAHRQADRATAQAKHDADQARREGERAMDRAGRATDRAATQARTTIDDATITTKVTAQLQREGGLDASKVDVDTAQGRVVLRGSAPDEQTKERAKQIALAVEGVKAVDNYLTVHNNS
jgi:osmotically-inducible protein OsmY